MADAGYFTVAEARAVTPLQDTTKYADADIDNMRLVVEEALEHACGVAFVPRVTTPVVETLDGDGSDEIVLRQWARPIALTAATVGGVALDAPTLAALVLSRDGTIYNPAFWACGRRNVVLTYTHGYPSVPGRVKRAAIRLTKRFLVDTPINDRATSIQNPEDGTIQRLITAGVGAAIFDLPEANAIVNEYGVRFGGG